MPDRLVLQRDLAFVDGRWAAAASGATLTVRNPATDEIVGRAPDMDAADTALAIEAANRALPAWRGRTARTRAVILRRAFDLMIEHREALARLLTLEQGKSLTEARGEITYAASFLEWFGEEAKRVYGDVIPATVDDKRILVMKQPIGVVAAITPWNFPSAMITRKIGPALAAGCTIVVKPASETPLSALALAAIFEHAGLPPGVLNVVTGDARAIGGEITRNPLVRKLSFTGSTRIGKILMAQCAETVKRTSMELGGNAPFIVFDDADIDRAVAGAMASKFRNAGQTCVCTNRFYVQSKVHDAFVAALTTATRQLTLGPGIEDSSDVGPLISEAAVAKIESQIADALALGAVVTTGGARDAQGGFFFQPTVLSGVTQAMAVTREETFGPLAPVIRFGTEADVISMANATEFGLAAYVFTRDLSRSFRVSEALESGIVGVNTGLVSTEVAPFGGIKESGSGREGSRYGIEDYLELKYVCLDIQA